jgi:two-component system, LytTR family, sensor kinase
MESHAGAAVESNGMPLAMPAPMPRMRAALAITAAWTVLVLLSCAKSIALARAFDTPYSVTGLLLDNGSWWYGWLIATPVVIALAAAFRLDDPDARLRASIVHLVAAFLLTSAQLIASAAAWAYTDGFGTATVRDPAFMIRNWYGTMIVPDMLTYVVIVGLYYAYDYNRRWKAGAILAAHLATQSATLRQQRAEAQLQALRMELNPHFLFNTLNAIVALVRKGDNARADTMLVRLSGLLRVALAREAMEVPLRRELELLDLYLDIERIRFAERLTVEFVVDPSASDALLPIMVLQPLVENSLRHGIALREGPGFVRVAAHRSGSAVVIDVIDSGSGGAATNGANGIGLTNVRQRLRALYGEADASLELTEHPDGGAQARLRLPYHTEARDVPDA